MFAAAANARSGATWLGLVAFIAIAGLGQVLARTRSPAADDDRLFGYAFLVGVLFVLRSGLAEQRKAGLDQFLRHNFVTAAEQATGHAAALVVQLVAFSVCAFGAVALLSGGDLRFAAWYTAVLGLSVALFLPAVLLVEMVSELRLPFSLVPVGLLIAMAVAEPMIGADRLLSALGLRVTRYAPASLAPLLVRVALAWVVGFGVLILAHARGHPPPGGRSAQGSWPWRARPARRS